MNKGFNHQKKLRLKILAVASGGLLLYSERKIRLFSNVSNTSRKAFMATETLKRIAIVLPLNPEPRSHNVRHCAISNSNVKKRKTSSREDGWMVRVCSKYDKRQIIAVPVRETACTGMEAVVLFADGNVHNVNTASCEAASAA